MENTHAKPDLKELQSYLSTFDFNNMTCQVTGKRIVALCVNPNAQRKTFCTTCLVNDPEFIKKYRLELFAIEDIKQKLEDGISMFIKADPKVVLSDLQVLKEKLRNELLETVASEFDKNFDLKAQEFEKALLERVKNPKGPEESNPKRKSSKSNVIVEKESVPEINWIQKPIYELTESLSNPSTAAECLIGLYSELSSNSLVRSRLAVSEMISFPDKDITSQKNSVTKEVSRLTDQVMLKLVSTIDVFGSFDPKFVLKRWGTLNQAYNYQNGLNSLCFMVSEQTVFFGYSQYFTTGNPIETRFKLVENDLSTHNDVVLDFTLTIRQESQGQPERTVEGLSPRTFPVFFPRPLVLKPQVWYNISFNKPVESHYIYYGSAALSGNGERFQFSDNQKSINFRRAADDTIDNSHSLGQFPDFYLK